MMFPLPRWRLSVPHHVRLLQGSEWIGPRTIRCRKRRVRAKLADVETWDAIRSRYNVRAFTGEPLDDGTLERILDAARRSPSSMNQQAWDFVVVTDRSALQALSKVWTYAGHVADSAATVAMVAPASSDPDERESFQFDLGQAAMSLMLAAADLGVGSGHAAVADQEMAREFLGLPDDRECMWLIALGFPADRPLTPIERPNRRPFDDVVHRERW
jgi:nitroreductase